jgi:hypothetical protein
MTNLTWNEDDWGTPADHGIDTAITQYGGFSVGEEVIALQDGDEDNHQFWFEGDEAIIIGFSPPTKFRGTSAILYFDGQDPMSCYDLSPFNPSDHEG